jgi:hypothetical protein
VLVQGPFRSVALWFAEIVDPYLVHRMDPFERLRALPLGGRTPFISEETTESILSLSIALSPLGSASVGIRPSDMTTI